MNTSLSTRNTWLAERRMSNTDTESWKDNPAQHHPSSSLGLKQIQISWSTLCGIMRMTHIESNLWTISVLTWLAVAGQWFRKEFFLHGNARIKPGTSCMQSRWSTAESVSFPIWCLMLQLCNMIHTHIGTYPELSVNWFQCAVSFCYFICRIRFLETLVDNFLAYNKPLTLWDQWVRSGVSNPCPIRPSASPL